MAVANDNLVLLITFHEPRVMKHELVTGQVRHSLIAPMQLSIIKVPLYEATLEVASANYSRANTSRFLEKIAVDPITCTVYPKEVPFGAMTKQLQENWPDIWVTIEKELEKAGTLKEWLLKCIT